MSDFKHMMICLVGPKRVGKDSTAAALSRVAHDVINPLRAAGPRIGSRVLVGQGSFAARLREAASAAYGFEPPAFKNTLPGNNWNDSLFYNDALKELPNDALQGKTPREVLIHLGAAMRAIDLDIWCRGGFEDVAHSLRAHIPVAKLGIITDMRFKNELDFGRKWCADNGWIFAPVAVWRDAAPEPGRDSADQEAAALRLKCNYAIHNNGSFQDLEDAAVRVLDQVYRQRIIRHPFTRGTT